MTVGQLKVLLQSIPDDVIVLVENEWGENILPVDSIVCYSTVSNTSRYLTLDQFPPIGFVFDQLELCS